MQVAPGLTVRVRDPYGGLIARNRLFVAFSIRYRRPADRARVAAVTWTLDGAAPRRDEGGRDQLLAPSTMYAAGRARHRRAHPAGRRRPAVEAELQVTATDCQLANLSQRADLRGGVEAAVTSGRPGAARDRAAARQRALREAARRAWARSALSGGRTRALRASALSRGGARRCASRALPRGTTVRPRAPRARSARARAPLLAVGVASPRQRRAAGARGPALLSRLAVQRREAPRGRRALSRRGRRSRSPAARRASPGR